MNMPIANPNAQKNGHNHGQPIDVFTEENKNRFEQHYPNQTHLLAHQLTDHPLLSLDALATLSETLPAASVEYNLGDLPIGIAAKDVPHNQLSIADTIRQIDKSQSWAVLKNVEQIDAYRELLHQLLNELSDSISKTTGELLRPQSYIFISSPGSMTPFHFDPEHNILLQLRGQKEMTVFPPDDPRFAKWEAHEEYHRGGHRNLAWDDSFLEHGTVQALSPGDAVYVPVMAPHFVRNGDAPSISLSITWRSEWSYGAADTHALNAVLRKFGLNPTPPKAFPATNKIPATAWRVMRKLGFVG